MMDKSVLIFHRDGYVLQIVRYSQHFSIMLHIFMLKLGSLCNYRIDLIYCNKEDNAKKRLFLCLFNLVSLDFSFVFRKEGQMYLLCPLDILQKCLSDFILIAKLIYFKDWKSKMKILLSTRDQNIHKNSSNMEMRKIQHIKRRYLYV